MGTEKSILEALCKIVQDHEKRLRFLEKMGLGLGGYFALSFQPSTQMRVYSMSPSVTVSQGQVASETFAFSAGKVSISATLAVPNGGLSGSLVLTEDASVLIADLKAAVEKASAANPTAVAIEESVFDALTALLVTVK